MNKKLMFIGMALIILGAGCIFYFLFNNSSHNGGDIDSYKVPKAEKEQCPLDLDAMIKENPDVYGVLEIPDTDIVYPILQSEEDDALYIDHNWEKKKDSNGALFTESAYNSKTFKDSVTVIYGHHMKSGAMFGDLQEIYSDQESFEAHREFKIYTEEETFVYRVFAALPYSNRHILYYYDFNSPLRKAAFFEDIFSVRNLGSNIDEEGYNPEGGEIIILSTCLKGNNTKRYIVIGQKISEVE